MTLEQFKHSLSKSSPPPDFSPSLHALWLDAKGNWDDAHQIVQQLSTPAACWVHAYLHREEGDLGNASYWYSRAGKPKPDSSLQDEWDEIAQQLLNSQAIL